MRKTLALRLSAAMVICLMPGMAFAEAEATDAVNVSTIQEFVDAAGNLTVSEIRVTADIDFENYCNHDNHYFPIDLSNKIVDLDGHKFFSNHMGLILQGENFTVKNGTFCSNADSEGKSSDYALFIGDEGPTDHAIFDHVIFEESGINIYNANHVILRNVTATAGKYYAVWCDPDAHVKIESGRFSMNENSAALLGLWDSRSSIEILGGVYSAFGEKLVLSGINREGNAYGVPSISGGTFSSDPTGYFDDTIYQAAAAVDEAGKLVEEQTGEYRVYLKNGVKDTVLKLNSSLAKKGSRLKWTKSTGFKADCYQLYRGTKRDGKYTKIYTTKSGKATATE